MNTVLTTFSSLPSYSTAVITLDLYPREGEKNLMNALNDNIVRDFNFDMTRSTINITSPSCPSISIPCTLIHLYVDSILLPGRKPTPLLRRHPPHSL
jgi:hypothetical protein